jgi:hypothetical protein
MAVPNDSFSLEDVLIELGGVSSFIVPSLYWAFDAADDDGFVGSGRDSLLDFAGYETPAPPPPPPTYNEYLLGFAASSTGACDDLTKTPYWGDGLSMNDATVLFSDSGGTVSANAGYYADDFGYRYWDGASFSGASTSCPTGEDPPPGGGFGF